MFGVITFGSQQYKVVPGEACVVEKIEGKENDDINFGELILLSNGGELILDKSNLEKYAVKGTILKQYRENKVIAFKKKRRKDYTRKRGHRQYKTLVLVKSIELRG